MTLRIPEGPYTIDSIMESIRTQVVEKAPSHDGGAEPTAHSEEHPASVPDPDLPRALVSDGTPFSHLLAQLELMRQRQSLQFDYEIRSHRPLTGRFIDLFKHFVWWGSRPFITLLLERQAAFNEATLQALREVSLQLDEHTQRGQRVTLQLDEQTQRSNAMDRLLRELHEQMQQQLQYQAQQLQEQVKQLQEQVKQSHELTKQVQDTQQFTQHLQQQAQQHAAHVLEQAQLQGEAIEELRTATAALVAQHDLGPFYSALSAQERIEAVNRTRGSFEDICQRQSMYVERFAGAPGPVLDLGCGRGELLYQLQAAGIAARGVDIDPAMVELCRSRDLDVEVGTALEALEAVADGELGGIFAAQVVEHFFPGVLLRFLRVARQKLAPGGLLVLETINAASLGAVAKSYFRDLDHKQPLHPDYLKLLAEMAGFIDVTVQFSSPFREDERLPALPSAEVLGLSAEAHTALQAIFAHLDRALYAEQDYHIAARQPIPLPIS